MEKPSTIPDAAISVNPQVDSTSALRSNSGTEPFLLPPGTPSLEIIIRLVETNSEGEPVSDPVPLGNVQSVVNNIGKMIVSISQSDDSDWTTLDEVWSYFVYYVVMVMIYHW